MQGSRYEPYVGHGLVTPSDGHGEGLLGLIPDRDELLATCTCPDDGPYGGRCKHALAALLVLADEVTIEPAVLERWRAAGTGRAAAPRPDRSTASPEPAIDVLATALAAPAPLPEPPTIPSRVPIAMAATPGTGTPT